MEDFTPVLKSELHPGVYEPHHYIEFQGLVYTTPLHAYAASMTTNYNLKRQIQQMSVAAVSNWISSNQGYAGWDGHTVMLYVLMQKFKLSRFREALLSTGEKSLLGLSFGSELEHVRAAIRHAEAS